MKLKLKPTRRQIVIVVVVLVALFVLLGHRSHDKNASTLDTPAAQACSDFAAGYPHAGSKSSRLALADKVTKNSQRSKNGAIVDRASEMGRAANDSNAKWKASADALTNACKQAGWKAS